MKNPIVVGLSLEYIRRLRKNNKVLLQFIVVKILKRILMI